MQAGKLRQRVIVQQVSTTQNSYGEPVETWSDLGTVWAEVRPASGNERFVAAGDQRLATLTHVVNLRYLDGLSPVNNRLSWDSRILDIHTVQDTTGREASMIVLCKEAFAEGAITAFAAAHNLDFSDADNSFYIAGL